jgi:hypothetical protein
MGIFATKRRKTIITEVFHGVTDENKRFCFARTDCTFLTIPLACTRWDARMLAFHAKGLRALDRFATELSMISHCSCLIKRGRECGSLSVHPNQIQTIEATTENDYSIKENYPLIIRASV